MSLCIVVRPADGGIIMCADTAISTKVMGQTYRIENFEDEEKIIEHNGVLVFCSGTYNKCVKIREYVRSLEIVDADKVQAYAQTLFNHDTSDNSTGIMICQKDGTLIGMLSAQDFKPVLMYWPDHNMGIHVLGFHMKEAFAAALEAAPHCDYVIDMIGEAFSAVLCEEVGGHIWAYSCREDTPWRKERGTFNDPVDIRKAIADDFANKAHCIISATDFLLNDGTSMKSALNNSKSKIKGEYIDIRGANIVNSAGDTVLYIDETGIHWTPKYSPFKYQFAVTADGPWHDEMTSADFYKRESVDGGQTWGAPYKCVAVDGKNGSDGSDANVPKYITTTGITQTTIEAPKITGGLIEGGELRVTGDVISAYSGKSELGVYDAAGNKYGHICYDADGAGTDEEAQKRMFIATENGKAMKIQSGGNLSIDAGDKTVYLMSDVHFKTPPTCVLA